MSGRDRNEVHRAATPLELLFDLCFVVAVAAAAGQLHHAIAEHHVGAGLLGYASVFFAIWWAWFNFSWFASAYDTDDVPYRVLTLIQMAGVLVLAAGVPRAFSGQFDVVTAGYVILRLSLIPQWLRVRREHPERALAASIYAGGLFVLQVAWVARLLLPQPWGSVGFALLVVCELLLPLFAEKRGGNIPWHPGHISERYGLFTIIVLGEVILASTTSIQAGLSDSSPSINLMLVAGGGLLCLFSMWWLYFGRSAVDCLRRVPSTAFTWGYAHYAILSSAAAVGAAIGVMADAEQGHASRSAACIFLAASISVYLVTLGLMYLPDTGGRAHCAWLCATSLALCVVAAIGLSVGVSALLMGLILALSVVATRRQRAASVAHDPASLGQPHTR